jgi:hypothetical protein
MPQPAATPLDELSARADLRLDALVAMIVANGLEEASLGDAYLGRRGADVLAHLHGWHGLFAGWCREDGRGEEPALPSATHTWDDLRALNDQIYERYRAMPWARILEVTRESHATMIELLRTFPVDALADPARYSWANGPLIDLADECLGKHYDWGIERVEASLLPVGGSAR